jgi:hypothetical protein
MSGDGKIMDMNSVRLSQIIIMFYDIRISHLHKHSDESPQISHQLEEADGMYVQIRHASRKFTPLVRCLLQLALYIED